MKRTLVLAGLCCGILGTVLVVATGGALADDVTVDITVIDNNGNPVGNAELTITWQDGEETVETTSSGVAIAEVPEGADLRITVDHPAYVRNQPYEVTNATVPEGETRLAVEIPVSLAGRAEITVEDADGPVENARVQLRTEGMGLIEEISSDGNGLARTARVEQGTYRVTVSKAEYFEKQVSVDVDGSVERTIQIERGSVDIQFQVTDEHFDPPRPIEGVRIELGDGTVLTTNEEGQARTGVRVNRNYEITISRDTYQTLSATLQVDESDRWFNLSTSRIPTVTLSAANERVVLNETTLVTVRNAYDEPVVGASILRGGDQVGETDENGQLLVPIEDVGQQEIRAEVDGRSDTVTVEGIRPAEEETPTPTPTPEPTPTDTPTDTPTEESPTPTDGNGPGFGVVAAILALAGVSLGLSRRR